MAKIRIAAVQMEHKDRDKAYNLGVIEALSQRASKEKVELISFPEMCITGYMYVEALSVKEVLSIAEPINGPSVLRLQEISKANNLIVSAGLIEKDEQNNFYNTFVSVGPNGLLNAFRKIHPFVHQEISAGSEYSTFDVKGVRVGSLICYDNNMTENYMMLCWEKKAKIVLAPHQTGGFDIPSAGMGVISPALWANKDKDPEALRKEFLGPKGREWLMRWLPSRAYDYGCYVVFSNGIGPDGPNEIRVGNACIIDPHGRVAAETNALGDDIAVADCDADDIVNSIGFAHTLSRRPKLYKPLHSDVDEFSKNTRPSRNKMRELLGVKLNK